MTFDLKNKQEEKESLQNKINSFSMDMEKQMKVNEEIIKEKEKERKELLEEQSEIREKQHEINILEKSIKEKNEEGVNREKQRNEERNVLLREIKKRRDELLLSQQNLTNLHTTFALLQNINQSQMEQITYYEKKSKEEELKKKIDVEVMMEDVKRIKDELKEVYDRVVEAGKSWEAQIMVLNEYCLFQEAQFMEVRNEKEKKEVEHVECLAKLEKKCLFLDKENNIHKSLLKVKEEENEKLKEERETNVSHLRLLRVELAGLKEEIEVVKREREEGKEQLSLLHSSFSSLQSEYHTLFEEKKIKEEKSNVELDEMSREIRYLKGKEEEMKGLLQSKTFHIAELEKENNETKEKNKKLKEKMMEMKKVRDRKSVV